MAIFFPLPGNVGIGTTNPQYLLSVKGTIGAEEVIVTTTGWSDYVFRPTYRLRPLTEVAAYIQENHHLPDIPTEAEVKENGISLGEYAGEAAGQGRGTHPAYDRRRRAQPEAGAAESRTPG